MNRRRSTVDTATLKLPEDAQGRGQPGDSARGALLSFTGDLEQLAQCSQN